MPDYKKELDPLIQAAAKQYGLDYAVLQRLFSTESGGFSSDVIEGRRLGGDGEIGIGQFMPGTAQSLAKQWKWNFNPADPVDAIEATARHLSELKEHFNGNTEMAVAAYNAGQGAVDSAIKKANNPVSQVPDPLGILPDRTKGNFVTKALGLEGSSDWKQYLPQTTRDTYVPTVFGEGEGTKTPGQLAQDWRDAVARKGQKGVQNSPVDSTLRPPNIADFQQDDGQGGVFTDSKGYYAAWKDYTDVQQAQREQATGPMSKYVDDLISEMSGQIASGRLALDKADTLLKTRMSSYQTAMSTMNGDAFKYGSPVGAEYVPGRAPGDYSTSKLGLNPLKAQQNTVDPMAEALATYNQAKSDIGPATGPGVPNYANMRMSLMQRALQESGTGGSVMTTPPPGPPPPSPPPDPSQQVNTQADPQSILAALASMGG